MAIQVVRGDVQPDGDPRPECRCRLELEAAGLDDVKRLGRRLVHVRAHGNADVAAHQHGPAGSRQHPSHERRRRRLPFRPRDGDDAPLDEARRQLELAHDLDTARACRVEYRLVHRHARAHHDQVGARQRVRTMAAELQRDAGRAQALGLIEGVAAFGQHHRCPSANQQLRRRDAAARGTDHHHPFAADREDNLFHAITGASTS